MYKYDINESARIFNLDESGFSIRGMALSCSKCAVKKGARGSTREVKFRGTFDHDTHIPVLSASGPILTPLFVLRGIPSKSRKLINGKYETPIYYLPQPYHMFYRPISVVDTNIFSKFRRHSITKTGIFRSCGKKIMLLMDGYSAHISLEVLSYLNENLFVVVGLPAHKSHLLQTLELAIFSLMRDYFNT